MTIEDDFNFGLRIADCGTDVAMIYYKYSEIYLEMNKDILIKRMMDFSKQIVNLCRLLPFNREEKLIGYQLFRSGTSVAANYRAACRARSKAEFIAKLGIVEEEADESLYCLK